MSQTIVHIYPCKGWRTECTCNPVIIEEEEE